MCRLHIPKGDQLAVHWQIAQTVINDIQEEIYSYFFFLNYNQGAALKFS